MYATNRHTHPFIRSLIQLICWTSIGCLLIEGLFNISIQNLLLLNTHFISSFYLWQPLTALFLIPTSSLTFGFFLDLAFSLIILSSLGTQVADYLRKGRFLFLFFSTALLSSLAALITINYYLLEPVASNYNLSLVTVMLLAITTTWTCCIRSQNIYFFFFFPVKTKAILSISLLLTVFTSLIHKDFPLFAAYFSAFFWSYFVGIALWNFSSPFNLLHPFEQLIKKGVHSIKMFWQWKIMSFFRTLKSTRQTNEEEFVELTLDKISQRGVKSLSLKEKLRLRWISFKRR